MIVCQGILFVSSVKLSPYLFVKQVGAQTSIKVIESTMNSNLSILQQVVVDSGASSAFKSWMAVNEPVGIWSENAFEFQGLLEHLNVTKDQSDYLWLSTRYASYHGIYT